MKIIVCAKQVPDTDAAVLRRDGTLDRAAMPARLNADDAAALAAALREREREPDARVTVLTMGPPEAEEALRECLAVGADEAVLLSCREFAGADTFATSECLAAAVRLLGLGAEDLVFCGRAASDGETAQVGPQLAEKLGIPQATAVTALERSPDGVRARCARDGETVRLALPTPCLLTCARELAAPRQATVRGVVESFEKPLRRLGAAELGLASETVGLAGSPTRISATYPPPPRPAGELLEGSGSETCARLAAILCERGLLGKEREAQ